MLSRNRSVSVMLLLTLLVAVFLLATQQAPTTQAAPAPDDALPPGLAQGGQPLDVVDKLTVTAPDLSALMAEDITRNAQGLPPRFAKPIAVQITPDNAGTWETLADGTRLWRLRVEGPKARSLNLGFERYHLPAGAKLFLYTPDYAIVRGPFTAADNEAHGQFWSPILTGQELVIELALPAGAQAELRLTSVNYGYVEFGKPQPHLMSGACNLDVICGAADGYPQVDGWRDQIRSVAVISTGGSTFCTGFLVNNTAQDLTPFFMTADHCGIDAGNAATLVTYWNYENSICRPPGSPASGGAGDGSLAQFNTGSIFRSGNAPSDFTLVELDDPIDPAFNVHWAGWDATAGDNPSAVAIHHPNTDEKRISFEDAGTTTTSYLGTTSPGDGTHIRVIDWDLGTTEGGSSGSPLFDEAHRVVGQLHGGFAACGNDDSDWYGRFSVSWTGGGTNATRLSNWLDPASTGTTVLDGRDRAADFTLSATPSSQAICAGTGAAYTVNVGATLGFGDAVTLSATGHPAGTTATFTPNPVTPPGSSGLSIGNTAGAAAGSYTITITGMAPTSTHTTTVGLDVATAAPGTATLQTPANGATGVGTTPTFTWMAVSQAISYTIEIATDPAFTNIVDSATVNGTSYTTGLTLNPNATYYWRVTTANPCGPGTVSAVFSFTTANVLCQSPALVIPDNSPAGVSSVFNVPSTGTLTDLNISVNASHTWVGDLIVRVTHGATTVTIIDRPGYTGTGFGCGGDNVNAVFDDASAAPGETSCTTTGLTTGPYSPFSALSAFNGQDLSGDWTITISDSAAQDVGTFNEWCLLPTTVGGPQLSIGLSQPQGTVSPGQTITYTASVSNTGSVAATGVAVTGTVNATPHSASGAGTVGAGTSEAYTFAHTVTTADCAAGALTATASVTSTEGSTATSGVVTTACAATAVTLGNLSQGTASSPLPFAVLALLGLVGAALIWQRHRRA